MNIWNQSAIQLVGYSTEEVMGKVKNEKSCVLTYCCIPLSWVLTSLPSFYITQNLVQEFITDEFKTAVQAVLDQALNGEETANFGE